MGIRDYGLKGFKMVGKSCEKVVNFGSKAVSMISGKNTISVDWFEPGLFFCLLIFITFAVFLCPTF
jgi:hypothetical protein